MNLTVFCYNVGHAQVEPLSLSAYVPTCNPHHLKTAHSSYKYISIEENKTASYIFLNIWHCIFLSPIFLQAQLTDGAGVPSPF